MRDTIQCQTSRSPGGARGGRPRASKPDAAPLRPVRHRGRGPTRTHPHRSRGRRPVPDVMADGAPDTRAAAPPPQDRIAAHSRDPAHEKSGAPDPSPNPARRLGARAAASAARRGAAVRGMTPHAAAASYFPSPRDSSTLAQNSTWPIRRTSIERTAKRTVTAPSV